MNTKIFTLAFAFFALSVNGQINRPMPVPGPVPTINLGKSHEFKLNNGLTVIVVENHKLPRVSATLTIDNTPFTLADQKGVDGLLGSMLGTGTEKVAKDDYNKKIEQLGGNVNFWSEGGSASSLTKYFDEVFGYFADGVINPKFDQKEFEAVKNRYIEGLKADEKSVEAAASRVRDVLTYGKNHPFAEYDTPEKIQKITLKDVQDFYKNYYRPDNAYLIFVGDITADKAKSLTTKLFSNWHKGVVKIADLPSVQQVKKTEVDIVNMPNAVQSVVSVTYPVNLTKKDKDYYAVQVASTILGGDFNSKLNMNLREKHGWTYGARGGVSDSRYIGRFFTNATVRNEVTDSAVIETMKEIRSMTQEKVDKEVLENVKAKFLGNFIMSLERPQTVASQALIKKIEGLNDNFYADYIKNINNVTVDDVLRVSKKYFRPDQAKIVVTGKAETIGEGLKKLGYPVNFYDAYGEPIADPSTMKKDAKVTTHQIADAYIKAVGGKANIEKVKTAHREGKISLMGMEGNYKEKYALPDKTAIVMEIMGMKIKTVFDGGKGYVDQMGQKIDFQKDQIDGMKGYNQLFPPVLSSSFAKASVEGIVTENGVEYYKVYTKEAKRTEYYDVKTGLLAKSEIVASTPQGDMVTVNVYKNYQPFDGVLMATTIETQSGPQTFKIELSKVEFNKNVSDVDFK